MKHWGPGKVKDKKGWGLGKALSVATTLASIRGTQGALKTLVLRPYSTLVLIFKSSAGDFHMQPKLRPKAQYNQFIVGQTSAREQVTIKQVTLGDC